MDIRIGHGYDLHRLATPSNGGKKMIVGGIQIDCGLGPISHSDGDAVMHAVTDSILSAIGEPDLGTIYPNTDPENENRDSKDFLIESINRANLGGWAIGNIDVTVICDNPKIEPFKEQICKSLRTLTGVPVNIKGKTHEGTDKVGAIEVHALALVQRGIQK
ncbi:MAG: 2-C-methyl-D-erythritol 2,4-cyclodiphosphate synthase [Phycisphaerales bacterium]|jgi:2-C-methyl-D-erythritol 2,4-cyclodiphosphate synthase|nr:2-C-methyl-D-erythritol 2,4-cyclodiphosphate synthase [Phycisphaerales bacterium]